MQQHTLRHQNHDRIGTPAAVLTPIELLQRQREQDEREAMTSSRSSQEDSAFRYITDLFKTATPALCSGAVQAVLFNPFDRALYVRVQHRRKRFLDKRNFQSPFQGFANAAVYRTISSASYIFWQDTCRYFINDIGGGEGHNTFTPANYPVLYSAVVGVVAGAANGLALNNMQAVKFTMWSQSSHEASAWEEKAKSSLSSTSSAAMKPKGFFTTAKEMYHIGGVQIFFRGVKVTMLRDTVFGLVYEVLRKSSTVRHGLHMSAHRLFLIQKACRGARAKGQQVGESNQSASSFSSFHLLNPFSASARAARKADFQQWHDERYPKKGVNVHNSNAHTNTNTNTAGRKQRAVKEDQNTLAFIQNVFGACCGCAASSPINYLRSLSYGTPLGGTIVPLHTLFKFHLREVQYVFRHGHTFVSAVKGRPQYSLDWAEIQRIEDARRRLGFQSIYTHGKGQQLAEEALTNTSSAMLKRLLRFQHIPNAQQELANSSLETAKKRYYYYPQRQRHYFAAFAHVNRRLNIGWGSLRVGLGMAVGQHVFAMVKEAMEVKVKV